MTYYAQIDLSDMKIIKRSNNTFCKEYCLFCGRAYDADLEYIYEMHKVVKSKKMFLGYLCYECGEKLSETHKEKVEFT